MSGLSDSFQRPISYLRISVTDRCSFRCIYCMPRGGVSLIPRRDLLTYEEVCAVVGAAAELGINKVRISGGEPLVRANLTHLVRLLSRVPGIDDLSLTTNGLRLGELAVSLKEAGLRRVNVSLDSLRSSRFAGITGSDGLGTVLDGIRAAQRAGLEPVKINMVVMRGINDDEAADFVERGEQEGWHVRFIELMPFGGPVGEGLRFVPASEVRERLAPLGPLEACYPEAGSGPARYYRIKGSASTIGFISPVSDHFCSGCNRLRLTADGRLLPCLLSDREVDLRAALRKGASRQGLQALLAEAVAAKPREHSLGRVPLHRSMYQIGG